MADEFNVREAGQKRARWEDAGELNLGGPSILHQITVTLDNDQIIHLPSTPVEIIPAQGANTLILPDLIMLHMKWAADYGNIVAGSTVKCDISGTFVGNLNQNDLSGVSALLAGGGPDGTWVAMSINYLASSATPTNPHIHRLGSDSGFYDSDIVNRPLRLSADNTGDFTDGHADNELQVSVAYYVLNTVTGEFE